VLAVDDQFILVEDERQLKEAPIPEPLIEFLLARLTEDEEASQGASAP